MTQTLFTARTRRAATALIATIAAGALAGCGSDAAVQGPVSGPSAATAGPLPTAAPGFRLVGLADIAIEVPIDWGTNEYHCGRTPRRDTVIVNDGETALACLDLRKPGIDSVHATQPAADFSLSSARDVVIGGRSAQRTATTCRVDHEGEARTCAAAVYFPAERVLFEAESSTSKTEVATILDRIRVLPGTAGVPEFQDNRGTDGAGSGSTYVAELKRHGLTPEIREERRPGLGDDFVLDANPAPGTVLRPGDTVVVTVNPPAVGPADQVLVFLSISNAEGKEIAHLSDQQIRAGATVRMPVGGTLRVYTKNQLLLGGELDGTSLVAEPRANRPGAVHWRALEGGTTRLTITVTNGDASDVIGVVTVMVTS